MPLACSSLFGPQFSSRVEAPIGISDDGDWRRRGLATMSPAATRACPSCSPSPVGEKRRARSEISRWIPVGSALSGAREAATRAARLLVPRAAREAPPTWSLAATQSRTDPSTLSPFVPASSPAARRKGRAPAGVGGAKGGRGRISGEGEEEGGCQRRRRQGRGSSEEKKSVESATESRLR
jgi:hypothetical protein